MLRIRNGTLALGLCAAALAGNAIAQQIEYNNTLVVPLVAETSSYTSDIFVHNPTNGQIEVTFYYTGATGSATAGFITCPTISIPPSNVVKKSLSELCPTINPGSNFGTLASGSTYSMAIYTRVHTSSGNGFSVEGMVDSVCCGGVREVTGLVRQAAAPTYQSNCFLVNQEQRPGRVVVTLVSGDGQPTAARIVDLQAREVLRMLDIFASVGAPAGDYANVRVSFESIVPLEGGTAVNISASCTVQNNTSFDADFRVAKNHF